MKRYLYILYIIGVLLCVLPASAQEDGNLRQIYAQAESDYQIGRFEQTQELLHRHLSSFEGNLKQNVYRLLALCYLAQDDEETTEKYAHLLLNENPSYSSVKDPTRFEDLINRLKSGRGAMITTASNQAESLNEVPVPVTLITEEMIRDIGARNLLDILTTYVPGMTAIESVNELNLAMRGVYKSTQQSLLIMVDGHRLNSHSTNSAAPDYAISLDKVKQIEVLRGPASSLYGNVALTGVVNIITKDGIDTNGTKVAYSMGNYGQQKVSLLFGKRFSDTDISGWASFFSSDGEKFYERKEEGYGLYPLDGDVILHRFNDKPSFDIGFKFKSSGFYVFYNYQYSQLVPSYSMDLFQAPYRYDEYRWYNGQKPGHSISTQRIETGYQKTFGKLTLKASLRADYEQVNNYDIAGDTIPPVSEIHLDVIDTILKPTHGCYQIMTWSDYHYDANFSAFYDYSISGHEGAVYAGIQYERYKLNDNMLNVGEKFISSVQTTSENNSYLLNEKEKYLSAFAQVKQRYKNIILNMGVRYDARHQFSKTFERALSPRIALIYLQNDWQMKVSYNKAFVDASYFLRSNTLPLYSGANDLTPEYMHSFQYTFGYNFKPIHLDYECNVFYNYQKDLIYYDSQKASTDNAYYNAGFYKAIGLENILTCKLPSFRGTLNCTWQRTLDSEKYVTTGHRVNNVPNFSCNLVLAKRLLNKHEHQLWMHGSVNSISKQTSYVAPLPFTTDDEYIDIPARAICSMGIDYQWKRIGVAANIYNLFNSHYTQGGTSRSPIRQTGRWALATISVKI